MKISYNWIKDFVDIDAPAEDVAVVLTMSGIEVEGLEHSTVPREIITARIIEVSPHPNADKLSICMVDTGVGYPIKVVCGAPNVRVGLVSAYAPEGVAIGDFKVKKAKIRGEESFGILLSEKELGLTDDHSGIMELDDNLKPGLSLIDTLAIEDWVFEVNVTPNRGDCLSVIGIARELSASYRKDLKLKTFAITEVAEPINDLLSIDIISKDGCPRYCARYIKDIKIKKSPFEMRRRLFQSGVRAINNVVDITNFVMLEYGQPLHAFDARFLEGNGIVVRKASSGEKFVTLDSVERILTEEDLLICDKNRAVALAGVMGGENSEVKEDTAIVVLESAFFNPLGIRRTSRRLGLTTEASYRFERGIDPKVQAVAADRAAYLMQELACGRVIKGIIDADYTDKESRAIVLRRIYLEKVLGLSAFNDSDVIEIFKRLGCTVEGDNGLWTIHVPAFRHDLEREIDLVEEFIRIFGMDKVKTEIPSFRPEETLVEDSGQRELRLRLASMGLNEIVTYSFISPVWKKWFASEALELKNPLSEEMSMMRTSLIPGLVSIVSRNKNLQTRDVSLFETGKCFLPVSERQLPDEKLKLAIALSGYRQGVHWSLQREMIDFYDIKGFAEALVPSAGYKPSTYPYMKPGLQADIIIGGEVAGVIGALSIEILKMLDVSDDVFLLELDVDKIVAGAFAGINPVPKFPFTWRDLSLVTDEAVTYEAVKKVIMGSRIAEIRLVDAVDIYKGEKLPEGKKGITIRITYRSDEKTLEDSQINKWQESILQKLQKELNASLRQ